MLEEKITALTAAVVALNETIMGWMESGAEEPEPEPEPEPAPKATRATKSGAKAAKPAITAEQVRDKLREVSADVGPDEAKAILAKMKVKKFTELKPETFARVIEMCDEALAEADAEDEDDDI